jgi:hypothetical protein
MESYESPKAYTNLKKERSFSYSQLLGKVDVMDESFERLIMGMRGTSTCFKNY